MRRELMTSERTRNHILVHSVSSLTFISPWQRHLPQGETASRGGQPHPNDADEIQRDQLRVWSREKSQALKYVTDSRVSSDCVRHLYPSLRYTNPKADCLAIANDDQGIGSVDLGNLWLTAIFASAFLICAIETVFCPTHAVGNSLITGSSGPL